MRTVGEGWYNWGQRDRQERSVVLHLCAINIPWSPNLQHPFHMSQMSVLNEKIIRSESFYHRIANSSPKYHFTLCKCVCVCLLEEEICAFICVWWWNNCEWASDGGFRLNIDTYIPRSHYLTECREERAVWDLLPGYHQLLLALMCNRFTLNLWVEASRKELWERKCGELMKLIPLCICHVFACYHEEPRADDAIHKLQVNNVHQDTSPLHHHPY